MTSRSVLRTGALLLVVAIVPACNRTMIVSGLGGISSAAVLRGSQVVPADATAATGTASIVIDDMQTKIQYSVSATGLGTVTSVRIHRGDPGTNGGAMFTLASGPFTNPLSGTLTLSDLTPVPGAGSFHAATGAILSGKAYVLITATTPAAQIRGQIGSATVASAKLTGAQEVPLVAGAGTGTFSAQLDAAQSSIAVTLTYASLGSATTAAHIHAGAAGVGGGPMIFNLSLVAFTSPLTITLSSADFMAGGGLTTFADAVNALLSGTLYVNIHTTGNLGGEIRGQIGPAQLQAALTAGSVVPTNSSTATGSAKLRFNGQQTGFTINMTHTIGSPTGVLIHADVPGSNGPLIFDVAAAAGASTTPIDVFIDGLLLVPQLLKAVNTFPDAVDAMITSKTYVDVSSTGFTAGEIRGQITP